jgi:GTP cyclohydrolase I
VVRAKHLCMACRGVRKDKASMVTSAVRGLMLTEASLKAEFLNLCREL